MAMRLRTLLGDHACTAALKNGSVKSDLVSFDFVDYTPTNKGFKPMVREQAFDVSEMAVVTYLMAKSVGKPMVLLPNVVLARFAHEFLLYNGKHGEMKPADLNGKRVGIRSFTTTTGAWLRGILANDYGVDLDSIDWVTFEDAHVAEYNDPTKRAPSGKQIVQMLVDGELDAVLGEKSDHPDLRLMFPDRMREQRLWFDKYGIVPINHMVVVHQKLCQKNPAVVREVHRLLLEAAKDEKPRLEASRIRNALGMIIEYSVQQGLIPRAFTPEELFDDVTRPLFERLPE
jgi:4,5-dihydroxyphthalate decarboxylase